MADSFPLTWTSASNANEAASSKIRAATVRCTIGPCLIRHFKNHVQQHRRAKRKAGHAINRAARVLVLSEHFLQQVRCTVCDFRLIADVSRSRHRHAEPDDSRY